MKTIKFIFAALLICAFVCGATFAQDYGYGGGFQDDGSAQVVVTPVKQALKMRDDSIVILRGNIARRIGDDKYLFRDATGEIVVEIDDEDWGGVTAGPKDTLELSGEIDRDFNKVKVDVYLVKKVSGAASAQQGFVE